MGPVRGGTLILRAEASAGCDGLSVRTKAPVRDLFRFDFRTVVEIKLAVKRAPETTLRRRHGRAQWPARRVILYYYIYLLLSAPPPPHLSYGFLEMAFYRRVSRDLFDLSRGLFYYTSSTEKRHFFFFRLAHCVSKCTVRRWCNTAGHKDGGIDFRAVRSNERQYFISQNHLTVRVLVYVKRSKNAILTSVYRSYNVLCHKNLISFIMDTYYVTYFDDRRVVFTCLH